MQKLLCTAAAAAMLLVGGEASAQTGFYIRGDVGGAFSQDATLKDVDSASANAFFGPGGESTGDVGNSVIFGAGVGYRFTPILRTDVTLSYLPSLKFKGTDNLVGGTEEFDVHSLNGMLNGYLDIAGFAPRMFGRFQPYIVGSVGFARNETDAVSTTVAGVTLNSPGDTHTDFAWGAGAGLGYAITPNIVLDVGYKYLDLGELRTGTGAVTFGGASTGLSTDAAKADLKVHTVTLGVRFGF
jgi:opacity protein-like surface antigen